MKLILISFTVMLLVASAAFPQTTSFSYQGNLVNGGTAANGNYDFEFLLYDALSGGAQIGTTQTRTNVAVANGNFNAELDFGSQFPGANRYLEIRVRAAASGEHTTLAPRQFLTSAPYTVKAIAADTATSATAATTAATAANATQLGGLTASRYIATDTNGRVGIGTTSPNTKFEVVDPVRQLRFGPTTSDNGGYLISTNASQAIIAGGARWDGTNWIARDTAASMTGHQNGVVQFLTNGNLGVGTPFDPTLRMHIDVSGNVGVGTSTPEQRLHVNSGKILSTGSDAALMFRNRQSATADGDWALYATGGIARLYNNSFGDLLNVTTNGNVGIGTTSPQSKLTVFAPGYGLTHTNGNVVIGSRVSSSTGEFGTITNHPLNFFTNNSASAMTITTNGDVGIGVTNPTGKLNVNGNTSVSGNLFVDGPIFFSTYAGIGGTVLCYNQSSQGLVQCSSSLRYKTDLQPFVGGLNIVNRLRPITYKWTTDGSSDVGFGAEEVAEIEPLLITHNKQGEIQGVKYERLSVVFVNAIKEQQAQIEQQSRQLKSQQMQLERQQREIATLRQAVKARKSKVTRR